MFTHLLNLSCLNIAKMKGKLALLCNAVFWHILIALQMIYYLFSIYSKCNGALQKYAENLCSFCNYDKGTTFV